MIGQTSNHRFLTVPIVFLLCTGSFFIYASITRPGSQPDLVIPRPNRHGDCTYGIMLLGTLKYDRIDIQSKVFNVANCIPSVYMLFLKQVSITRPGRQPDLVMQRPNRKSQCTYGIMLLGTLKYDRIDIQSNVFNGAICISTVHKLFLKQASITREHGRVDHKGLQVRVHVRAWQSGP